MKRILGFVSVVVMVALVHGVVLAQSNSSIGTWKMNPEKSKFSGTAPKDLTLTLEAQGDGVKSRSVGTAADGTKTDWGYTANYDRKDSPVTGTGAPGGADTVALKHINANATAVTLKKAGKTVRTARMLVSTDGKVLRIAAKGSDADGKPMNDLIVFDKQ